MSMNMNKVAELEAVLTESSLGPNSFVASFMMVARMFGLL